jgi:hypothetical protein
MAQGGFEVFDSDMHVLEPADLWERYIEAPFTHRAPLGSTHTPKDVGARCRHPPSPAPRGHLRWSRGAVCVARLSAQRQEGAGPGPSLDPDSQRWARMFLS